MNCKPVILDGGIEPVYMTKEAACADLAIPRDVSIEPHSTVMVGLALAFEIENGSKLLLYPRSSLLVKYGIMAPTSVIDSDYRGREVHAILHNLTDHVVYLEKGTRVLQVECQPSYHCFDWQYIKNERTGGTGSTGEKS